MSVLGKLLVTLGAMGAAALGTGAGVLAGRRRAQQQREPLRAVPVPRPNLGGLAPPTPAPAPTPGVPNAGQATAAAALLKSGNAAVDDVVRNSKADRVAALEAYGTAWRLFGQASEAIDAMGRVAGGKNPSLAAELERLRLRLQSLQSQGAAILRKVPSWLF